MIFAAVTWKLVDKKILKKPSSFIASASRSGRVTRMPLPDLEARSPTYNPSETGLHAYFPGKICQHKWRIQTGQYLKLKTIDRSSHRRHTKNNSKNQEVGTHIELPCSNSAHQACKPPWKNECILAGRASNSILCQPSMTQAVRWHLLLRSLRYISHS